MQLDSCNYPVPGDLIVAPVVKTQRKPRKMRVPEFLPFSRIPPMVSLAFDELDCNYQIPGDLIGATLGNYQAPGDLIVATIKPLGA